jgi:hypothetical protein
MSTTTKQQTTKSRYKSNQFPHELQSAPTKSLISDDSTEYANFPKIKDIITDNMKSDKLFLILQKLSEEAKSRALAQQRENLPLKISKIEGDLEIVNTPKLKKIDLFENEEIENLSLESYGELDQELKSLENERLGKGAGGLIFQNPKLTLNDIINDSEFNQANLNNFPTNGLGENIKKIEKEKSEKKSPKKKRRSPRKNLTETSEKKVINQNTPNKKKHKGKIEDIPPVKFIDLMFPITENEVNLYPKKLDFGMRMYPKTIQNLEFRTTKRLSDLAKKTGRKLNVFNGIHPDDVFISTKNFKREEFAGERYYGEKEDFRCIMMQSGLIDREMALNEQPLQIEKVVSSLAEYNGNVFFLSVLSALAVEPSLVKRLIEVEVLNSYGVYSIWLNFEGFWRKVVIDDRLPYDDEGFIFAGINPSCLSVWPLLVEKAYAKCYEGYNRIPRDKGLSFYLKDLTGAPVLTFPLEFSPQMNPCQPYQNFNQSQANEAEEIWRTMVDSLKKGYFTIASTEILKVKNGYQRSTRNLIAFPILNCLDLSNPSTLSNRERIVQLRQPLNFKKFSNTNSKIYQSLEVNGHKTDPEGDISESLVWLPYEIFLQNFTELAIAMVNPGNVYTANPVRFGVKPEAQIRDMTDLKNLKIHTQNSGECIGEDDFYESYRALVKVKIWEKGEYTISFNKPYKEKFYDRHPNCKGLELRYMSAMTMGKLEHDKIRFVDSKFDGLRNSIIHKEFEIGEYVILLDIRFTLGCQAILTGLFGEPWKYCSISCYGPKSCSLIELEQDLAGKEDMDLYYGYFEHKIWKNFINHPPQDISQYIGKTVYNGKKSVEMINQNISSIRCRSLSVNHIIIEELKNDDPYKGLTFEKEILYCLGYEIVAPDGRTDLRQKYRIYINPGESEIVLLRFGRGREREFKSRMM